MFNNNQPSDKKSFNLTLTNRKLFHILVTTINKISGWVWNSKLKIVISASAIILLKASSTIRSKIRIVSYLKSLYRFALTTVKVSRIRTAYTVRMRMRVIQALIVKRPLLSVIFKMIMKLTQTVKVSRIRIAYTVILAQFLLLGQHDYSDYPTNTTPYTLGNRDVLDLEDMDGIYL